MADAFRFLPFGSRLNAEIRAHDWSATPLGPPERWPPALRVRLTQMLACPTAMFLAWGPELLCFYNDAYQPLLGYRASNALGRPFRQVWASIWDDIEPLVQATLAGQSQTLTDVLLDLSREGQPEESWWSFTYSPVLDDEGAVNGLFCVTGETTDRVLAEKSLRESEDHFRHTVELNPQVPWTCDPDGNITSYSSRWLELTGQTAGEPLGSGWTKALHPDDVASALTSFAAGLASGEPIDVEYRIRRAETGEFRKMRARAFPRRDAAGAIVRWYGVVEDVHDRKLAEAQLTELNATLERRVEEALAQRKLWADMFETTDALVCALDPEFCILAANRAWIEAFEAIYAVRPSVGRSLLDLLSDMPDALAQVRSIWARALAGEEFTIVEAFGDTQHRRRHYECKFTTLRDARGEWIGAFQYVQDVTERLHEQDRLAQAEEALRQAQKLEAIGQLTGGVAHDFNNMLTIIRSSVEFLRNPDLKLDRRARYLAAVSDTVDRASKLTNQLLAFARRQPLTPQTFEVGARLQSMRDMLSVTAGARVRIVMEVPTTPRCVWADASQFEISLVNLVANARDAMAGEGTLTLRLEGDAGTPCFPTSVKGPCISLSVTDEGTGIAPDVLPRIFEPFFTTKSVGKGTGLGLSQVIGFARQSGGDMEVFSEVGRGSTFTLYLPSADPVALPSGEHDLFATVNPDMPVGLRVLVVEDNLDVGRFCTQILEDFGHVAVWAHDAESALVEIERTPTRFDAVFSDVVMPGMGGVALARHLRSNQPELPVILTTGYSDVLARDESHGFDLVRKPYSAAQVAQALRLATRRRTPA